MKKKLLLLVGAAAAIAAFVYFDLGQYLSLESLKNNKEKLDLFYQANAWPMVLGFIGVYIVTVGLSLPGATILTLAGGAIFGAFKGTLAVNVGATLGATLAFLAARFLLRDWVESKFGDKLQPFNEGFSKNAVNYILFLRLVPLFPFFLINLLSGLTRVPLRVYFFGTLFGTLPGTFVYANAGSNLASIESLQDIVSPGVLGSFVLLGLFALIPTLYKKFKNKKKVPSEAASS
ncbi:MAG: TVP38/TMEM64 family protein [Nitrospinales bacterium]